jgi:hypothetical protein
MNYETLTPTPEQEDPELHRLLVSLPSYMPSAGFEDRVLSRVYRPAPAWVRALRRGPSRAFDTRKVRWWIGGMVASSAVASIVLAIVATTHWMQLETTWSTFSKGIILGAWRDAIAITSDVIVFAARTVAQWNLTGPDAVAFGIGGLMVVSLSAWGLHHTMRQFYLEKVAPNARP